LLKEESMSNESSSVPADNRSSTKSRANPWSVLRSGLIAMASCALVAALSGWIGWDLGNGWAVGTGANGKAGVFLVEKVVMPALQIACVLTDLDPEYRWASAGCAAGILAGLFVGIPRRRPIRWAALGAVIGTLDMLVFHAMTRDRKVDLEITSLVAWSLVSAVTGGIVCAVDRWKKLRQSGPAPGGQARSPSST
jgi:hypothetical protein